MAKKHTNRSYIRPFDSSTKHYSKSELNYGTSSRGNPVFGPNLNSAPFLRGMTCQLVDYM